MSLNFGETDWRNDAACAGMGTGQFFTPGGKPTVTARAACAGCVVRGDCLEDALGFDFADDWGFQGGKTRNEREAIRAEREQRIIAYRARQRGPLTLLAGGIA